MDFGGLPELVRTFLQVAAGAADIPVTRLLGQSPAGLSATGDSDTRNYYDMISARQELDLRPQLERLDGLLGRSAGVAPGALGFAFRPLWQLSAAERAQVAMSKAQATAIYAGLGLWPAATTAALVRSQLIEDGTYPGAEATFGAGEGEGGSAAPSFPVADYDPGQPRDPDGRWSGGASHMAPAATAEATAPAATKRAGAAATISRLLAPIDPLSSAAVQEVPSPGVSRILVAAHVHEDPLNQGEPEDEEESQLREELKELDDPLRGPRMRPDGVVTAGAPPLIPRPVGIDPETWSRVGPGPFARQAIPASLARGVRYEEQRSVDRDSRKDGCHRCGTPDPGAQSGAFVGDHQPPTALNAPGSQQYLLPHCRKCSDRQGGLVRGAVKKAIR